MSTPMPEPREPMERREYRESRPEYREERPEFRVVQRAEHVAHEGDMVRWGPVVGGMVATISILLALTVLGLGVGLATIGTGGVITPADATMWAIWGAVSMIVALFFGGWFAARTSAFIGTFSAIVDSSLVWATTLVVGLFLAGLGVASVFGPLGGLLGLPTVAGAPAPGTPALIGTAGIFAFIGLVIGYVACVLGGLWGTSQEEHHYGRTERELPR